MKATLYEQDVFKEKNTETTTKSCPNFLIEMPEQDDIIRVLKYLRYTGFYIAYVFVLHTFE